MKLLTQEKGLILLPACYMTTSLIGLGKMDQQLHADNCVGQNKNNTIMQVCIKKL